MSGTNRDSEDLEVNAGTDGYFAHRRPKSDKTDNSRMTLTEFFLTENEEVAEKGAITREQLAHFVDLTYVATVFNINHLINGCSDRSTDVILLSISYFFILFTTRYHFDIYSIMFYSVDLVHRCLFLVFNIGVFVMTFNIKATSTSGTGHRMLATDDHHDDPTDDHAYDDHTAVVENHAYGGFQAGSCVVNITYLQGFASGYLASRLTLILMYSLLIYFAHRNEELNSQRTYIIKVIPLLLGSIVMIPIYWESVNPVSILLSVAMIEIFADIIPEVTNHYLQKLKLSLSEFTISMRPDVDKLQDRLQEFFLIVLGESMIGLLINPFSVDTAQETYIATLFSFTLMFSLGSHFLVCVHRSAEQVHAMKKKNALIRIIYIWLHPIICYVLLITTNALVQLTQKISDSSSETADSSDRLKRVISVGLAITILIMVLMRVMHKGIIDHLRSRGRVLHVLFKIGIALTHLLLYWIVQDKLYFILSHSFVATFTNMVEMLIPVHSKSRAVNILFFRTTVNAETAPGAQRELNSNRKSLVARMANKITESFAGETAKEARHHSSSSPAIRNAIHHTAGAGAAEDDGESKGSAADGEDNRAAGTNSGADGSAGSGSSSAVAGPARTSSVRFAATDSLEL